jgi:hypothetical protein
MNEAIGTAYDLFITLQCSVELVFVGRSAKEALLSLENTNASLVPIGIEGENELKEYSLVSGKR